MPNKVYLEITNVCNLDCEFCHGTKRAKRFMSEAEFVSALRHLGKFCDYLYFHLMGEPLLHPLLGRFFDIAAGMGFKVIITTNGTLLAENGAVLLASPSLHKVSISLHAYEANSMERTLCEYLDECFSFCRLAAERGIICVLRLWNIGGAEALNGEVISHMQSFFGADWTPQRSGYKIADRIYLEWGNKFDWPDINADIVRGSRLCYALRDQIGIHCDGTVVPCCLDAEGDMALGNIFTTPLEDILSAPRAVAFRRSFEAHSIDEPLCMRCGYAAKQ